MGLAKKILNLCGHEIWPPTHGDPTVKGPQPRILTRRQWEAMEEQRQNPKYGIMCTIKTRITYWERVSVVSSQVSRPTWGGLKGIAGLALWLTNKNI